MKKILVSRKTYKRIMNAIDVLELIVNAIIMFVMFMGFTITVLLLG